MGRVTPVSESSALTDTPPAAVAKKLEDEDDPPREKVVPIVKEETVQ